MDVGELGRTVVKDLLDTSFPKTKAQEVQTVMDGRPCTLLPKVRVRHTDNKRTIFHFK